MSRKKRLFCDINPTCYAIAVQKGIVLRHIRNFFSDEKFSKARTEEKLPNVVSAHSSNLIKRGKGIDPVLQENKAVNIALASGKINGMIIRPGETFSFYKVVGKATKRKGYKEGRFIRENRIIAGMGGGLCNLGNTIHWLVLHSPLEVTEVHFHSDALAPDAGKRVPFSSGTSVCYNYIDLKFRNNTRQNFQLMLWCEDDKLFGELRSEQEIPWEYRLVEENHHFRREGEKYYRISQIYKETTDKKTGEVAEKKLVRDNRSEVMFDYDLIPKDQIRGEDISGTLG